MFPGTGNALLGDGRICETPPIGSTTLAVLHEAYLQDTRNPTGFVSALISHCVVIRELDRCTATLRGRHLSYKEVDELTVGDRRVIRASIARARKLPDRTVDDSDDGLVRALEEQGAFADSSERSIFDALRRFSVLAHHALGGVDPVIAVQALSDGIREALDAFRAELDDVQKEPLFFVIERLPVSEVRRLLFECPSAIEDMVSRAVIGQHDFVASVIAAADAAPYLHEPQREDLRRGCDALIANDPFACRHLIAGLEGALWRTAHARGVIDHEMTLVNSKRPQRMHVGGIGTLLRPDGGLDVGTKFAVFLLGAVFNDDGNDIRHGRAVSGHRTSSIWSFVALLGWLDRFSRTELVGNLQERMCSHHAEWAA